VALPDELPIVPIDMNGVMFEATPANACLYTFLGRSALPTGEVIENASRNHIFLKTGDERLNDAGDIVITGSYVFGEAVGRIGAVMLRNDFPAELNKRTVPVNDEAAHQSYVDQQETAEEIDDYIPEGWDGE
jgi:hypothetical protein